MKRSYGSIEADLCPTGYQYIGKIRSEDETMRGGGVGIIYNAASGVHVVPHSLEHNNPRTFEMMSFMLKI